MQRTVGSELGITHSDGSQALTMVLRFRLDGQMP